tara:strand:+ start:25075 stop:25770 length:696 start_codon:yes stop_codon:yes gene_type:complete
MNEFDISSYQVSGDRQTRKLWSKSFAVVLGLHAGVAALAVGWAVQPVELAAPPPAIFIDMMPTPPAPARPKVVEEEIKPKELPVIEKAEVVLKPKPKPKREKPKPRKQEQPPQPSVAAPPAAPKLAQSPTKAAPAISASYLSALYAHIERHSKYPRAALWTKPEGVITVQVKLDRKGHVLASRVVRSSGFEVLDEAALATFRRADPLPPFPASIEQNDMTINLPVRFQFKD